jgi:hypothetical protein
VWWIVFTAVDLYIGLVLLDLFARSAPPEKMPRIRIARKIMIVTLVVLAIAFVAKIWL